MSNMRAVIRAEIAKAKGNLAEAQRSAARGNDAATARIRTINTAIRVLEDRLQRFDAMLGATPERLR